MLIGLKQRRSLVVREQVEIAGWRWVETTDLLETGVERIQLPQTIVNIRVGLVERQCRLECFNRGISLAHLNMRLRHLTDGLHDATSSVLFCVRTS